MDILAVDMKRFVRHFALILFLYFPIVVVPKPAQASGTVSTSYGWYSDYGLTWIDACGDRYVPMVSPQAVASCVNKVFWKSCDYMVLGDYNSLTNAYPISCHPKELEGVYDYAHRVAVCPTNSTGTTTCTCNTNYIPDTATGTYCAWDPAVQNPDKNMGSCSCGTCTGNPINAATGLKFQTEIDYLAPSGLEFKRTYNSYVSSISVPDAPLGTGGWQLNWQRSIQASELSSTASAIRADGKVYSFNLVTDMWMPDEDVNDLLTTRFVGFNLIGWTYITGEMDVEQYNAIGQLISVADPTGQTTTLSYSDGTASGPNGGVIEGTTTALPPDLLIRVTDAYGRELSLGYDAQSRIVRMTDPAGGVYGYGYDANSNLKSVTFPDQSIKTYLYENATYLHALTGIQDENNIRYATYGYDSLGRADSTEHAGGAARVAISYNTDGSSSITDALNTTRAQTYQVKQGVVKSGGMNQPGGSGCGAAASTVNYDDNGNVTSRVDFNGSMTVYDSYDLARNLETSRTEGLTTVGASTTAAPRTILTDWDSTYRLPHIITEKDVNGVSLRSTVFNYDPSSGNLTSKVITDEVDPSIVRTWAYGYYPLGLLHTVDGPRTDVYDTTTYDYAPQGNLKTITNPLGQETTLGDYDANGRPGTLTDPNGLVTGFIYDARGRLKQRSTGSEITEYAYYPTGNLKKVTLPSGAVYTYSYDNAHRLVDIAENSGSNHIHYTLDDMGNRVREEIFDTPGILGTPVQIHSRDFDALNRLHRDIGAINNEVTVYEYYPNGNLKKITDPLNHQTTNYYDALNRLISSTDPVGGQTKYDYTDLDQLFQVTDPRSLVTKYTPDALSNNLETISPDTGTSGVTYDAAGNVMIRTDAKGQVATYTYDALNRVKTIDYTYTGLPTQSVAVQYDQGVNGIGHLTGLTDETGTTAYSYDIHGRLKTEVAQRYNAIYTTSYAYDTKGRLKGITYPSGRTVNYPLFDAMGRISQIATTFNGNTQILASNIQYQPFGGVQSFTFGDGTTQPVQTYTRRLDKDGRIDRYTLGGRTISVDYDFASQITSIRDLSNLTDIANYLYDSMGRLEVFNLGTPLSQSFIYDANGNRTYKTVGGATTFYGIPAFTNAIYVYQIPDGGAFLTAKDANGAAISSVSVNYFQRYFYDLRGRLVKTTTPQDTINYKVNALGLRVRKQALNANTDTAYHYDIQGHLLGESATGTTQFTKEYIYLGDLPVAVLQ